MKSSASDGRKWGNGSLERSQLIAFAFQMCRWKPRLLFPSISTNNGSQSIQSILPSNLALFSMSDIDHDVCEVCRHLITKRRIPRDPLTFTRSSNEPPVKSICSLISERVRSRCLTAPRMRSSGESRDDGICGFWKRAYVFTFGRRRSIGHLRRSPRANLEHSTILRTVISLCYILLCRSGFLA
jgi:hypothetical protein